MYDLLFYHNLIYNFLLIQILSQLHPHQRGPLLPQQQILGYQRPKWPYSMRKGGPLGRGTEQSSSIFIRESTDNNKRKLEH